MEQAQRAMLSGPGPFTVFAPLDAAFEALPDDTLEALRLLTNLETEQRKLLQVVLFGQPELDRRLASYQFRQLRQRISFSYQLTVLNRLQVQCYLQSRLQVAGVSRQLFQPLAILALWHFSRGIPRLLNILAHKALMLGYGKGLASIGLSQVWQAVLDTEDVKPALRWSPPLGAMVLAALGLLVWWWMPPGVI